MAPQRNIGAGAEAELPEYAGHYRLEAHLGAGGMGVVHLARSTSGLRLAVKVVHAEFAKDREFRGRFRQEVAAARRVSGAFTAPVVDADPEVERPWMATLFIPGPTLADHVKRNGPMEPAQLRRLMAGLAEALRDIHRVGVVHRDLKPSNVLLAEDGPKVIDFGISRPKDSELRTETGKLIGTPPFMAPEQFRRPREVGPAADIFTLGSVLVHAATGRGPFDSDSPYVVAYQVVHDEPDLTGLPENLAPLVLRCLAKEPEDRPTPDELMRELRSVSASYDTRPFIPTQRTQQTQQGHQEQQAQRDLQGEQAQQGHQAWGEVREPGGADHAGPSGHPTHGGRAGRLGHADGAERAAHAGRPDPTGRADRTDRTDLADLADGAGGAVGADQRVADPGASGDPGVGTAEGAVAARAPRRRWLGRRAVLVGGALALALCGVAASVLWFDDGGKPTPVVTGDASGDASGFDAWRAEPAGKGSGMPRCTYGGDKVLCLRSGLAYALDPADGSLLWRHTVAGERTSVAPGLSGGLLHLPSDEGRQVEAVDPASGTTRWKREVPGYGAPRFAGGMLLVTGADGSVTGVDGLTGATKWTRRVASGAETPSLAWFSGDSSAYATTSADGTHTRVTAVDPVTGDERWQARLAGNLKPVGSQGGSLFLLSVDGVTGETDEVVRYTPGSGTTRRVPLPVPRLTPQATVRGDVVYLLSAGGALEAVDVDAGKRSWHLETSVSRGSEPVADDRHVYFSAADGRLLAVDARDGRLVGQTPPRLGTNSDEVPAVLPAPLLIDGHLYAGAPDGTVFALDARDPAAW
ncbi:protein kinase domain-containing protein [Streptomyces sp. MMS24-I2-30]|uniref:serine/threonine-protein kinase n=1 Tax=Streptomyces sp. MMS24-I2-30 TaxID=3351564 RepID=UPI003896CF52